MNTTSSNQDNDAPKKAQALLKFALGNHNAKRYNEAAGFYEMIIQRYPDTEAAQYARKNLEGLVNKIDGLEVIKPDATLIARIEQPTASEPVPSPVAASPPRQTNATASIPYQDVSSSVPESDEPPTKPAWKRLRIAENPYLLVGLFFFTAIVSYFIGREHVKYEIRQVFTGAAEGFRKNMSDAMAPLRSLQQDSASTPTEPKVKPDANKPKVMTFPVKLNSKNLTEAGYRKTIDFRIRIDNPMDRPIKAFEGRILFKDVLGKLIIGANLSYRDGISAKGSATWAGEIEYNQFIDRHREISNIDIDKLLTELEVYKVAYEDGTIEEFPKP